MKNKWALVLVVGLIVAALSACGPSDAPEPEEQEQQEQLGGQEQQEQQGQQDQQDQQIALDTMVAATMQALATQNAQPAADQPQDTGAAPPAAPTDTLPPTETYTPVPSLTATPTNTLVPSVTATLSDEDPRQSLGGPDFVDTFDQKYYWNEYSTSNYKTEIKSGKLFFTMFEPQFSSSWFLSSPEIEDYYLEVTAKTGDVCEGKDRYGLIFRAPDPNAGYIFTISCDGNYRLASWEKNEWKDLINWQEDDAIHTGPNQTNRIGVWVDGKVIKLYVNGVLIDDFEDNQLGGEAKYGLVLASAESDDFLVTFDDLMYWELP
ncbi:hypothetical protein ACFLYP_01345 [Chloroflexota bacterium]